MSKVYLEILDDKRLDVFRKLSLVDKHAFLIGGTALALQIKHRKSIDFYLALDKPIKRAMLGKVRSVFSGNKISVSIDQPSELTVILDNDIKVTFLHYPFPNLHPMVDNKFLKLASLKDLASAKAQTIGRRGEWKDYVDLYVLLTRVGLNLDKIIKEAEKRFQGEFSEKLFLEQLVYWNDISDYEINYVDLEIPKSKIQSYFSELVKKNLRKVI